MVIHEGDLVQNGNANASEWVIADAAFDILDAGAVPYLVAIGNHDYDDQAVTRGATSFNANFPQVRFTGQAGWSGGFFETGHSENSYWIKTIGNATYLFMVLEYGPRAAVIAWANTILTNNSDKTCILVTHSYMYRDNTRTGTGDQYNPKNNLADAEDGEDLWNNLVKLHDNIIWVQSGHDITGDDGAAFRTDLSNGGQIVNQVLANYQDFTNGGDGFLRLLTFNPATKSIQVQTYSPLLGMFLSGENSFNATY